MAIFGFAAVVTGLDVGDFDQLDRLFTEDFDITPGDMDGVTTLEVEVEAASGEDALKIFHDHICQVGGIAVDRLDEDLVNTSEIAARLDVSRETPRVWANPTNDVGLPFPKHHTVVGSPGKPQRLWRWADVYAWVATTRPGTIAGQPAPLDAAAVTWFNAQMLRQVETSNPVTLYFMTVPSGTAARGKYGQIDYQRSSSATIYHTRSAQTLAAVGPRSGAVWLERVS
ncbi:MAG: hypothetical protein ACYC1Z_00680 [Georgenia sp.]